MFALSHFIYFYLCTTLIWLLGKKSVFCATTFICRRIGWWLSKILRWVQKIMSLPFRFFFFFCSSHGCFKQSQLCQVFNLAWVNAKLISHEEEFEISLLFFYSKETSRQMGFKGMLLWSWRFFTHHLFPCQNRT